MNPKDHSRKNLVRPLPRELADVALIDINDVCGAVRMSASWVHEEVRCGRFPHPLRFGPRCTRWRVSDVRRYLVARAEEPQAESSALVEARARRGSDAARAKRVIAAASVRSAGGGSE